MKRPAFRRLRLRCAALFLAVFCTRIAPVPDGAFCALSSGAASSGSAFSALSSGAVFAGAREEAIPCYRNDAEHGVYASGDGGRKTVALTFDDGPHPKYTGQILDLLKKYGVRATFFVIGANVDAYPEVFSRTVKEGHCIGTHTYTHPHLSRMTPQQLRSEFLRSEAALAPYGVRTTLFRPPEGVLGKDVLAAARERGYRVILWSVDTEDWKCPPASSIVARAGALRGGGILLMHDYVSGKSGTVQALSTLLPALLEQGYEFVTVEELIGQNA